MRELRTWALPSVRAERRNCHWCSDGFEIGCDNGERLRAAFLLDCCDLLRHHPRPISGEDVRELMVAAVEHRFGSNRLPVTIEWLSVTAAATSPATSAASPTLSHHQAKCARQSVS